MDGSSSGITRLVAAALATGAAACCAALNKPGPRPSSAASSCERATVLSGEVRAYDSRVVDHCVRRLLETADGGDACLDRGAAAGVAVTLLSPSTTGFAGWQRDDETRGNAVWAAPASAAGRRPTGRILFLHGGGYTHYAATSPSYVSFVTRLAALSGMAVLSIDYRMAPEHPYPAAVDDAVAALQWLARYGRRADDPDTPLFVCGDSAGGGLAAALLLRMRDTATTTATTTEAATVAGCVLLSPWLDLTASGPSISGCAWNEAERTGDPVFHNNDGNWIQDLGRAYLGITYSA
eukprot:COSAG05_NODE_1760_length_4133_cov_5.514130_4_plen_294_part_00